MPTVMLEFEEYDDKMMLMSPMNKVLAGGCVHPKLSLFGLVFKRLSTACFVRLTVIIISMSVYLICSIMCRI